MPSLGETLEPRTFRFGIFEADFKGRVLRKGGMQLRLQEKPFQILELLLERPGELVTRQELRHRLWPGTFVEFDRCLNTAVNSLRTTLGDSALNPRFVETRPRLGYRFIAPVESAHPANPPSPATKGVFPSIAVMPFQNLAGDPELEYLSDGITDGVISSLSQLREIRVMARSTVFRYKGRALDPQQLGRELAASNVLVGEISLRGDSLAVEAELVEAETGWRLWGRRYSRRFSDLQKLEAEISREIAGGLRVRLSRQESHRLTRRSTSSAEAYQDYLKGRFFWNRMTEESVRKAVSCFERALEKDPAFALAYAGLSDAFSLLAYFDLAPPSTVLPKAREVALKALQIDPELAEAHVSLAGIIKTCDWDWRAAEREYQKALEINPHYAEAHRLYAILLSALGRSEGAEREHQAAKELDPLSLVIRMEGAWILYMSHEYERAMERALDTLDMEQNFSPGHFVLGLCYEQMGKFEVASAAFEKIQFFAGNNSAALAALGHVFGTNGLKSKAMAVLKVLEELSRRQFVSPYSLALVLAGLGKSERALDVLEKSLEVRDVWLVWLARDPRFDGLRVNPRFQAILDRIGLAS
jgi:TolB-like protein/Flp pilus assembly protein TadD